MQPWSSPAYKPWHGPIEEWPMQRAPYFPHTPEGEKAFTRYILTLLQRHGMSHDAAVLFGAHVAREVAWGSAVWNNDFGNIKTAHPSGPYYWLTDNYQSHDRYRAYYTDDDGIEDNIRLVRDGAGGRYKPAWAMMLAGDPNWYGTMGRAGYYQGDPDAAQTEYNSIVHTLLRYEAQSGGPVILKAASSPAATALRVAGASLVLGAASWYAWEHYR